MRRKLAPSNQLSELTSQFLATLNHEMRTPLTGILGMLDLILETELTREQREYALDSRQCAENLLEIMNATLEYSALAADLVVLEQSEFPLMGLLQSLLDEYSPRAGVKGLTFIRNLEGSIPEVAVGDAVRIRKMLASLIDNAIKFTSEGEVEVGGYAKVRGQQVTLHLWVRDTGIGIAESHQSLIFESFRQLEAGIARRYSGIGLGLAVTQKLAQLMQAQLTLDSAPGKGSKFMLVVPLTLPQDTFAEHPAAEHAA